jgi:Ca2+-binding RTX toxin-like protein
VIAGLVALALAPASASAGIHATFDPAGNGTLIIQADHSDYVNDVALVDVTPSGGQTDLVIGDVAAGIADPLPLICPRVDPTIIRCPLSMIHGINIDLGRGNDTMSAKGLSPAVRIALRYINANLGSGRDVAVGGPTRNTLAGGPGRDVLTGGNFGDKLFGGGQNDFLVGLGGNDLFQCGNGGKDRFDDGPGKDLVNIGTCEVRVHAKF